MTELRIGTADLPPRTDPARYFEALGFLESSLCLRALPTDKVLRRWRAAAPAGGLALVAPRAVTAGRLEADAARIAQLDAFVAASAQLAPSAVVFRTSPELAPSAAGRDALRAFFGQVAAAERFPGAARIWQPDGLWEIGDTARFAPELGVIAAIDPLAEDPGVDLGPAIAAHLARGEAYLRPSGLGRPRGALSRDDLDALAALVEAVDRVWVVFATLDAWRAARSFKKLTAMSP